MKKLLLFVFFGLSIFYCRIDVFSNPFDSSLIQIYHYSISEEEVQQSVLSHLIGQLQITLQTKRDALSPSQATYFLLSMFQLKKKMGSTFLSHFPKDFLPIWMSKIRESYSQDVQMFSLSETLIMLEGLVNFDLSFNPIFFDFFRKKLSLQLPTLSPDDLQSFWAWSKADTRDHSLLSSIKSDLRAKIESELMGVMPRLLKNPQIQCSFVKTALETPATMAEFVYSATLLKKISEFGQKSLSNCIQEHYESAFWKTQRLPYTLNEFPPDVTGWLSLADGLQSLDLPLEHRFWMVFEKELMGQFHHLSFSEQYDLWWYCVRKLGAKWMRIQKWVNDFFVSSLKSHSGQKQFVKKLLKSQLTAKNFECVMQFIHRLSEGLELPPHVLVPSHILGLDGKNLTIRMQNDDDLLRVGGLLITLKFPGDHIFWKAWEHRAQSVVIPKLNVQGSLRLMFGLLQWSGSHLDGVKQVLVAHLHQLSVPLEQVWEKVFLSRPTLMSDSQLHRSFDFLMSYSFESKFFEASKSATDFPWIPPLSNSLKQWQLVDFPVIHQLLQNSLNLAWNPSILEQPFVAEMDRRLEKMSLDELFFACKTVSQLIDYQHPDLQKILLRLENQFMALSSQQGTHGFFLSLYKLSCLSAKLQRRLHRDAFGSWVNTMLMGFMQELNDAEVIMLMPMLAHFKFSPQQGLMTSWEEKIKELLLQQRSQITSHGLGILLLSLGRLKLPLSEKFQILLRACILTKLQEAQPQTLVNIQFGWMSLGYSIFPELTQAVVGARAYGAPSDLGPDISLFASRDFWFLENEEEEVPVENVESPTKREVKTKSMGEEEKENCSGLR